jgi:hypothetical protein
MSAFYPVATTERTLQDVSNVPLPKVRQRHSLKELGHRLPGFSISPYFFAPDGGADI